MQKLLFIYNPRAGKGKIQEALAPVLEVFTKAGYQVTVRPTQGRKDATLTVVRWGPAFDRIVCCGGDGTLNEVVTGLLRLKNPPVLGYIPTGSTNDFAKNLGLPNKIVDAAACAVSGTPRAIDVGALNGTPYIYVAAFGLFTDVSYDTPQELKNAFGHLAYVLAGITKLSSVRSYRMKVEYDGGVIEDEFIYGMVSNTVSVGGFRGIQPDRVVLDDGLFEVMLVRKPKNLVELNSIAQALIEQVPHGNVIGFQTPRVKFTGEESIPWTLDGEFGGDHREARVDNLSHAITIVYGK